LVEFPEEIQSLEFARLCNPNMSVPVLEIDDKIITDSLDITRYLSANYPSKGDTKASNSSKSLVIDTFIAATLKWDEYLFSYRRLPTFLGIAVHNIRLVCLSDAIIKATSQEIDTETLLDGRTLRRAYVEKIAQVRSLIKFGRTDDEESSLQQPELLARRISSNDQRLDDIFSLASSMLTDNNNNNNKNDNTELLLMGDNISSADIYLAVIVSRISMLDGPLMEELFEKYPITRKWWTHFKSLPEAVVLFGDNDKKSNITALIKSGKPWKFLGYALGCYKPKPLPDDIERDVQAEYNKINDDYLATAAT